MLWLIFAHFIGDIALQSEWQANNKAKYWYVMLSHCMIWTTIISIALVYLGLFQYWKIIFLFIGHFLMDEWKSHQPKSDKTWWQIYPDQAFHLIQTIVVYIF